MTTETRTLTLEQVVPAPPDAVYRAFTNSSALREWLADMATTVPREGGRFYVAWNDGFYAAGSFTKLQPGKGIAFTWQGREQPAPVTVRVTLAPEGEAGTHVLLRVEGLGEGEAWDVTAAVTAKGWRDSLENLASVMATGEDLRFTRRPMLGILVGEFNEKLASELGVPVTTGIRLDSVLEGMGAAAAGLQPGDVLVAVNGADVSDWPSLVTALSAHRAGDTVEVIYYRGPEKQSTAMTLSGRPIPQLPATLKELADAARERFRQIEVELDSFFEGVGDSAALFKPGPDEWSAAEVLAHILQGERYRHYWLAELAGGHEGWHDDWGGNVHAQVAATVRAYPTVNALLDELKRHHLETVAFIEQMPAEFADRRGSFWRLAYELLDTPQHHRDHLEQMRAAIEQAPAAEPA